MTDELFEFKIDKQVIKMLDIIVWQAQQGADEMAFSTVLPFA